MAATFGGAAIFGRSCRMQTAPAPRQIQKNEYFGLSGYESLDGGSRGYETVAVGVFVGADAAGLDSQFQAAQQLADGVTRTLVDTTYGTYGDVRLLRVVPTTEVHRTGGAFLMRGYRMEFEHNL